MNADMLQLMAEKKVSEPFVKWLVTQDIFTFEDFVWAARNKHEMVDEEIITPSKVAMDLKDKVPIRIAWYAASEKLEARKAGKIASAQDDDRDISEENTQILQDEFDRRHSFKLGSKRLLSGMLQEHMRKAFNMTPKTFKLVLPDKLLLLNVVGTSLGNSMVFLNGQLPKSSEIVVDPVGDVDELWLRIRALLSTLSYISITRPTWFSFGDSEELSDNFFSWMHTKYEGRRLSLQFFLSAYIGTFQHFYEEIRLHNTPLSALVKNISAYRPFWTQSAASSSNIPNMSPPPRATSGNSAVPDSGGNEEVLREMNKLRQMNDKLFTKMDGFKQNYNGGGGGHKGGGNKGGNGKYDNKRPRDNGNGNGNNNGNGGGFRGNGGGGFRDNRRNDDDARQPMKVRKGPEAKRSVEQLR